MSITENKLMEPFGVNINLATGEMLNPKNHLVRRASDMKGHYKNEDALNELIGKQNNPLHYEVFETPVPEKQGHLMYCISKLQPGLVDDECFMTKGHYHSVAETAEIYLCLLGDGYMIMKTSAGEIRHEKMTRGHMVYVPPFWAHRSVNIGNQPLISFCVYPANAGHNYGDIEKEGFPERIFLRDGNIVIKKR